jgi:leucyl aminopeptidase (aminopeptidase T)
MRATRIIPFCIITLLAAGCAAGDNPAVTEDAPADAYMPDLAATAQNLARAAAVKEGDVVLITGSTRDIDLLENVAIEVMKLGGDPMIVVGSDRLARRSFDEVPAKYDAVESKWGRITNSSVNVVISVDGSESPTALEGVPAERMQARAKAGAALGDLARQRGQRLVDVGNGLYPTAARAERFGMAQDELARQFWNAVNADPAQLAATGNQMREALRSAQQVRVTHTNGTDITFGVDAREVFVNDGAISAQDMAAGGVSGWKYLPAGEVFVRVAAGSANGKVVVDELEYFGQTVRGLTIDVANGRIASIAAASGGDAMIAAYNAASGDGRDQLTILDIGINPAMQAAPDSRVRTWVPAGMVTLVFGGDVWANGTNNAAFSISAFQPGSTVTVDGRAVVENGALKL